MTRKYVSLLLVSALTAGFYSVAGAKARKTRKGYSFPVSTLADGNNATILRKFLRRNGIPTWEESKDYGYVVWAGPFPDESRARYLEPFFCLRSREFQTREEAEQKASFVRDRNFPAMVDSRYDITDKKRVYWVYIGYAKTRQEAVEVLKGFSYYPDAGDYLTSLDPDDETAVTFAGGYLAHPDLLFGAADIIGDRHKEILLQEERTDEYELFSDVAPPSNKSVDTKRLGYKQGPLTRDIGILYFDEVSGGWKKAGVLPLGADPMSFVVNSDVKLMYRNMDSDKDREVVARFKRQEREGNQVCSSRDVLQVYDLPENPVMRYREVKLVFDVLDSQDGKLFNALKKNRRWKGTKAVDQMMAFAEKKGMVSTALSLEAGRMAVSPSLKVSDKEKVFTLLRKASMSARCKQVSRCQTARHEFSLEPLGPTLVKFAELYKDDLELFKVLVGIAAECNKCTSQGWREGLPYCKEFYRAVGTVSADKGRELSDKYFREGMKKYVRMEENPDNGPKALLDFLHAAELDPENGEALYKAACVAARRNAMAMAADLLAKAFDVSLSFKARARDDDNFAEMMKSPKFSDLFETR